VRRRSFLLAMLAAPLARADEVVYPVVTPGRPLRFPRDHGAHPSTAPSGGTPPVGSSAAASGSASR